MKTTDVTSVEDLETVSPDAFLIILGEHDISVTSETDINRWKPDCQLCLFLSRGFLVEEVVIHPEGLDIALLKLQVSNTSTELTNQPKYCSSINSTKSKSDCTQVEADTEIYKPVCLPAPGYQRGKVKVRALALLKFPGKVKVNFLSQARIFEARTSRWQDGVLTRSLWLLFSDCNLDFPHYFNFNLVFDCRQQRGTILTPPHRTSCRFNFYKSPNKFQHELYFGTWS